MMHTVSDNEGQSSGVISARNLRPILAKFVHFSAHALHVLSYNEIPDDKQVTIEATAG